jgi:hypothetical protein
VAPSVMNQADEAVVGSSGGGRATATRLRPLRCPAGGARRLVVVVEKVVRLARHAGRRSLSSGAPRESTGFFSPAAYPPGRSAAKGWQGSGSSSTVICRALCRDRGPIPLSSGQVRGHSPRRAAYTEKYR